MVRQYESVDDREQEQGRLALEQLRNHLRCGPLNVHRAQAGAGLGSDFRLTLPLDPPVALVAEIKKSPHLAPAQLRDFLLATKVLRGSDPQGTKGVILLTRWVSETVGEQLRQAGVYYADEVGNAFLEIDNPRVLIVSSGKRPQGRPKKDPGRLVEPSALKVIQELLSNPQALQMPVRLLGPRAGVSAASANIVIRELHQVGYLMGSTPRRRAIQDPGALLEHFVRGYQLKLRPKLLIGTYRHKFRYPDDLLRNLGTTLQTAGGKWATAGATAAGLLTQHLKTDAVTLMVDEASERTLKSEPMLPDAQQPNLILLRLYAPAAIASPVASMPIPVTTSLLVYAELLNDGRPREMETAEMLRESLLSGSKARGS